MNKRRALGLSAAVWFLAACGTAKPPEHSPLILEPTAPSLTSLGNNAGPEQPLASTAPSPSPEANPAASTNDAVTEPAATSAVTATNTNAAMAATTTATETSGPARTSFAFADFYPEHAAIPLSAWKRTHHAAGPTFEQRCWELGQRVGIPLAIGLLCLTDNRSPQFTLARIYRLEDNRLRQVWQATVRTYANWLELTPLLDEAGELTLHDHARGACEAARSEASAKAESNKAPPSYELLGPACSKRGKYRYDRRQYRQVESLKASEFPW